MSLVAEIKNKSKNTRFKKFLIFCLLIAFSYVSYSYFVSPKEELIKTEDKIASIKKGNLKTSIEADSRVVLKDEINLDFALDGQIKEIYKNPGDYIKAGEKIASLDSEYLDIAITKSEIALKTAKANYEIKKRGVSNTEIDISQKQLDKDNISLETSKKEIDLQIESLKKDIEVAKRELEMTKKESDLNVFSAKSSLDFSKLELENTYSNLEITYKQEEEKYQNLASKLVMETGQMIINIEKNLYDIDMLLGISDANKYQNDSFEIYLGAKNTSLKSTAENSYRTSKTSFDTFYSSWQTYKKNLDLTDAKTIGDLQKYILEFKLVSQNLNKTLSYTIDVLKNSIASSSFTQTIIDSYINSFENSLSQAKTDSANYNILYQNLSEAKTSWDVKILSSSKEVTSASGKVLISESTLEKAKLQAELDLENAEQKILDLENTLIELNLKKENARVLGEAQSNISKANLDNKKYSDNLDIEPFYMAVLQASETLKEAQKKKEDSILYAPIDGKIAKINAKVSENTNSLKDSFATIINDNSFFLESYVEEADIVKVKNNQDVYITFDAIDGLSLTGKVLYIEDKATIDTNSIVSYKVEIIFSTTDKRVKDAMTAISEFITKEVKNVLYIPVSAVKNIAGKPSVIMESGDIRQVITGFTDGKLVELISGLKSGEKVKY